MKGEITDKAREHLNSLPAGKTYPLVTISHPNEHLISRLESLLDDARKGELVGLAYVCQWKGDSVSSGWALANMHARKLIGEIEFMKRDMMESVD